MEAALIFPHEASFHEPSSVLRPIAESIVELAGASTAAVWLRTTADRCPRCRTVGPKRDPRLHIVATAGPFGDRDCASLLADEWEFVRGAFESRRSSVQGSSMAVFPLIVQDEMLGVLAVRYRPRPLRVVERSNDIIGSSPAMQAVLDTIQQVASTDTTVLLVGETGTGKELIAKALHAQSRRAERPLVSVNCGAIAPGLIESELFGHERGAFTGALQRRIGRFESADKGTLFLDEISELPPEGQVKLLRALQEGEIERVGGSRPITVDVRLVAATNRDLERDVEMGRVRSDLFYRLNVLPVHVPPLRERRGDIARLTRHFIAHFQEKLEKPLTGIDADSLRRLQAHTWPGNVRELRNVIERACVLARGPVISIDRLVTPSGGDADESLTSLAEHERAYLQRVLGHTKGRISGPRGAAAILGLHPNTLRSRLDRLGITAR